MFVCIVRPDTFILGSVTLLVEGKC